MERAFDRVNPGDEVPPPPEELREWASNTATGTLGGMIYGMIQAARTDPFVNAAGEPMSAIVAKRHRWMRGAHEATMGGLRVGSFVAVFSAIEMGAQVKRGGARDMWNTALAGTVTAAATGLAIPGGIATRLRGAALGLTVGAGIGLPLGYARYELERTVLVPEREKAATARGETTETRGKRDYTGEVIADARRSMTDADAAVAKRRRWFPWFRG